MFTYQRLELKPVINATCHWTAFGGTVMWPEVVRAMEEARKSCVDMRQLLDRAGEVISDYTHAEAAHVVSGCAAGLVAGAAAIMTGDSRRRMMQLPHTTGPDGQPLFKDQFVARRFGRAKDADGEYPSWGYAQAVRGAGAHFVEVGDSRGLTREQFEAGFGPHTAGVYWVSDGLDHGLAMKDAIQIAHTRGVPVLVDASNTLPPAENLHAFIDMGADLVAFSGGKGLRGPQGSGILTGRADLIRAARAQSAPIQGIGRPLKVSKEEIVGLLTALELWASRDHAADLRDAKRRTQRVVDALDGLRTVRAEHVFPDHAGRPYPTVFIHVDPECGLSAAQVVEQLLAGDPPVAVMGHTDPTVVRVDVRILSEDETERVIARLREVLAN
ncbi:MAG TPA: aminotransferase class V-fold PLP-dependent enzyme [Chloroflexota bacterium]|nr:aminotransferase class V-fold PLP-dependent enzyme [Chloroflexota bacterium]